MSLPGLSVFGDRRPLVFAGPSLSAMDPRELQGCEVRPPVRRGDLEALRDTEPRVVLVVDGLFGASMAVTPLECRQLLSRGFTLLGAASIGALRASELWSAGMIGVGSTYQLLRLGIISSDAEVAVAYHPDTWSEVTVSMVQVRALVSALRERDACAVSAELLVQSAASIYWLERSWPSIFRAFRASGLSPRAMKLAERLAHDPAVHPKKRDAAEAIRLLNASVWPSCYRSLQSECP